MSDVEQVYPVTFLRLVVWYVRASSRDEAEAAANLAIRTGAVDALGPYEWTSDVSDPCDERADCAVVNGRIVSLMEVPAAMALGKEGWQPCDWCAVNAEVAELRTRAERTERERDALAARVITIADEETGLQPVIPAEEALTLIERALFERRRLVDELRAHALNAWQLGWADARAEADAHRLQHGGAIEGDDVCEWQERAVVAEAENDALRTESEDWRRRAPRAEHARDSIDRTAEAAEKMRDDAEARAVAAEIERDDTREKYEQWLTEQYEPLHAVVKAAEAFVRAHDDVALSTMPRSIDRLRAALDAWKGEG